MSKDNTYHSASYVERLQNSPDRNTKLDLAAFVSRNLVNSKERVFVASGTTAAAAGLELLCRHPEVLIYTHSIPLAWHFMEFTHQKHLDASTRVEVVRGAVNSVTGIIENNNLKNLQSTVFLYSPHHIGARGLTGFRDKLYLQAAWKVHKKVILLATYAKLLSEEKGSEKIKDLGHIRYEREKGTRTCELVLPKDRPKNYTPDQNSEIDQVIERLKDSKVTIHYAPRCSHEVWEKYFKNRKR